MFRTLQVPFLRRSSGPKLTRGLVDLVTVQIAARVLGPVMKPALSKAKDATTRVSHWLNVKTLDAPPDKRLSPAFEKLNQPFPLPQAAVQDVWGPLFPRPDFLSDLDQRLAHKGKPVLYVGPSNLGKSFAVLSRFASSGSADEKDNQKHGIPGVIHLSMRQVRDEYVFKEFADAVGLEPTLCPIALKRDFTSLLSHWVNLNKRPVVLILEDLHTASLSTPNPRLPETPMLTPNAGQLMGMLVNLQGLVFTIITASDPVAVPLLRSVSGATARFDIVNFPPTSDDWLVNGLRYTVVDERNKDNVELLDLPFVAASGEVEQLMTTMKLPANQQLVLESYEDCVFVVKHLGSHFGDLQVALKHIVEGASAQDAVAEVIASYDQPLVDAVWLKQKHPDYSPDQFTVAAFKTFEKLSENHLEPIEASTILSPEEKKHIPPFALHAALNRLVTLNLITFPSTTMPTHIQSSCRALHFSWQHARDNSSAHEAVATAYAALGLAPPA